MVGESVLAKQSMAVSVWYDGSERVDEILRSAMLWDVMGGVARRSWARNPHAMETSEAFNDSHARDYQITMPYVADEELIKKIVPYIVGK